jgi:hypothetical protein
MINVQNKGSVCIISVGCRQYYLVKEIYTNNEVLRTIQEQHFPNGIKMKEKEWHGISFRNENDKRFYTGMFYNGKIEGTIPYDVWERIQDTVNETDYETIKQVIKENQVVF